MKVNNKKRITLVIIAIIAFLSFFAPIIKIALDDGKGVIPSNINVISLSSTVNNADNILKNKNIQNSELISKGLNSSDEIVNRDANKAKITLDVINKKYNYGIWFLYLAMFIAFMLIFISYFKPENKTLSVVTTLLGLATLIVSTYLISSATNSFQNLLSYNKTFASFNGLTVSLKYSYGIFIPVLCMYSITVLVNILDKKVKSVGSIVFDVFNYTFLVAFAMSTVLPFIYVISASFASEAEVTIRPFFVLPYTFSLEAYAKLFDLSASGMGTVVFKSLGVSVFVTAIGTVACLFFTTTLAYALSRKNLLGRDFALNCVIFTMLFGGGMIPTYLVARGFAFALAICVTIIILAIFIFMIIYAKTCCSERNRAKTIINSALFLAIGIIATWIIFFLLAMANAKVSLFDLLNGTRNIKDLNIERFGLVDTLGALVLPGVIASFNLIVVKNFFQELPAELMESAAIDGCSDFGIFFKIVLPLSAPVLATFGLFYAVGIWNNYFGALLYIDTASKFPFQLVLRNVMSAAQISQTDPSAMVPDETMKMAIIVAGTVPILAVYPFLQKHFAKGVMIGAIKG